MNHAEPASSYLAAGLLEAVDSISLESGPFMVMNDVTRILSAIRQGDPRAADQLLPLVYDELRRLAHHRLSQETPGQTLQATALVHEAYLRLVDGAQVEKWDGRGHFFAAAAEAMRRILVENARRRRSQKRGGDLRRQPLPADLPAPLDRTDELLAVDEALDRLAAVDSSAADLVKLRYFAGFTIPEAAERLGISPRKANQIWAYARAWLLDAIREETTA